MPLTPGARLGPYEIVAALGAGGMGEVYRARDTKLGRDVALKILPESFTHDPERVARFRREAQVLASLNHPHIAQIHGLDEANGTQFLVLELVDGESLDKRIARGAVPVDEALDIARQIAEGLEAAHEKGIIHRDLKPANIALTNDGHVKVLDFGLAKAAEAASGTSIELANSPTITSPAMMTSIGVILGTAAYMSPEQAKGRAADKRSDLWAFGCVLYEMLTGKRAFEGQDVSDTLAGVLRGEADWTALPSNTPPAIRKLIEGCLLKERQQRVADMSTARYVLSDRSVSDPGTGSAPVLPPRRPLWRRAMPLATAALVGGVVVGAVEWSVRPSPPPALITRFPLVLPEGQQFTNPGRHQVAISPDGSRIVYVANLRLYLRSIGDLDVRPIAGTEIWGGAIEPVFSPDGREIAFYAQSDSTLKRISVNGGAAVTVCPTPHVPYGMSWGTDGIVFGQGSDGILRVPPSGGQPELLVKVKDGEFAHQPQVLANDGTVLFTLGTGRADDRWDTAKIVVQSPRFGERRMVASGADARYLPSGHLVYAVGGVVFAVRFDLSRLAVVGGPTSVVEGVRRVALAGNQTGAAQFSVSTTGSLVYIPGPSQTGGGQRVLAEVDRATGHLTPLKLPPGSYQFPRYAPKGTRVAFQVDEGKQQTIAIYDLSGATNMRPLTLSGANRFPIWSADGQRIAFQSDREGDLAIFQQRSDGTGPVERLTTPAPGTSHVPDAWSPDGQTLLFEAIKEGRFSLRTLSLPDRKDERFGTVESTGAIDAAFSRDGHWIAYARGQTFGMTRVHVEPFPRTGTEYASNSFALSPLWLPDNKALLYDVTPESLAVVTFSTRPSVEFGNPETVAKSGLERPSFGLPRPWDLSLDGTRILGIVNASSAQSKAVEPTIQVVLNWFDELKARVPVR